jgi:uncharacterized membrane protein
VILPENDVIHVDMSIEEALTYIISVGIVTASDRLRGRDKLAVSNIDTH